MKAASDTLVVYFTYIENVGDISGMDADAVTAASIGEPTDIKEGNLIVMAKEAVSATGADLFSVHINETYDPDTNVMADVSKEDQQKNTQFTFKESIRNLDQYDTIYIGVPVWWDHLPQPMVCFFDEYDFSGKTIVPFCIHLGSGFGSVTDQMKELEPDADIKEGFTIRGDTDNEEVRSEFRAFLEETDS